MNEKTLLKLEYDKIINLLVDQASSESGKRVFNTCKLNKCLQTAEMRYFFVKFYLFFCCMCCIFVI